MLDPKTLKARPIRYCLISNTGKAPVEHSSGLSDYWLSDPKHSRGRADRTIQKQSQTNTPDEIPTTNTPEKENGKLCDTKNLEPQ